MEFDSFYVEIIGYVSEKRIYLNQFFVLRKKCNEIADVRKQTLRIRLFRTIWRDTWKHPPNSVLSTWNDCYAIIIIKILATHVPWPVESSTHPTILFKTRILEYPSFEAQNPKDNCNASRILPKELLRETRRTEHHNFVASRSRVWAMWKISNFLDLS